MTFGKPFKNMGMLSNRDLTRSWDSDDGNVAAKSGRDSQQNMIWTTIQERGAPLMCDTKFVHAFVSCVFLNTNVESQELSF